MPTLTMPLALVLATLVAPAIRHDAQDAQDARDAEVARIQAHLDGAIELVEGADTSSLSAAQLGRRHAHIARLRTYRDDGVFPANDDHPGEVVPAFRDRGGVLCAMAFLIEESGRPDLVEKVRHQRNHATILELADDPELVAWLLDNGLSIDEAARIQPSYTQARCFADDACEVGSPSTIVVWRSLDPTKTTSRVEVVEKFGECAHGPPVGARRIPSMFEDEHQMKAYGAYGELLASWPIKNGGVQLQRCGGWMVSRCLTADTSPPVDLVVGALLSKGHCRDAIAAAPSGNACEARPTEAPVLPALTRCPEPGLTACGCTADGAPQPWPALALGLALTRRRARRADIRAAAADQT